MVFGLLSLNKEFLFDLFLWRCKGLDIEFDAVNDNLPEIIEFYGNNSRKVTCGYYIDDRILLPDIINVQA